MRGAVPCLSADMTTHAVPDFIRVLKMGRRTAPKARGADGAMIWLTVNEPSQLTNELVPGIAHTEACRELGPLQLLVHLSPPFSPTQKQRNELT